MDWDEYFISEAYLAARKSKDPSTQVGAVIVGPDREIRSKGYNGPPRGFNDGDPAIYERPLKYALFCHAEENAITSCARVGVSAKGCTLYSTTHPCTACARMIVQSGIVEVVLHAEYPGTAPGAVNGDVWRSGLDISKRIFEECGVRVRWWSGTPVIREIRAAGAIHRF